MLDTFYFDSIDEIVSLSKKTWFFFFCFFKCHTKKMFSGNIKELSIG